MVFPFGAPGETEKTAGETLCFAEREPNDSNALAMFTTGIRVPLGTELAVRAREMGYIPPDQDLIESVFCFSPQVTERWLPDLVDRAVAVDPNVVHAAEDRTGTAYSFPVAPGRTGAAVEG